MVSDELIGDNGNLVKVFDMVFLIPTYNRYNMLVSIIKEIEIQCVNKKYKIIIFDDNSTDIHYSNLTNNHENLKYYKSETNNGNVNFYKNINYLLNEAFQIESKIYTFLADDLQLSKNFVTHIESLMLIEGVEIINYHINQSGLYTNWGYGSWVDGAFVMSNNITKTLKNFKLNPNKRKYGGSRAWTLFTSELSKEKCKVYFTNIPLVKHLGHTNSVMHTEHRKKTPLHTNGFIDDLIEYELKLLEPLDDNIQQNIKKKSVTSGGNVIEPIIEPKPIPHDKPEIKSQISSKPKKLFNPDIESKPKPEVKKEQTIIEFKPIEPIIESKPIKPIIESKPIEPIIEFKPIVKPTEPEIKSPIKSKTSDNKSKSSISKIPNDLDIGRLRKQRLNFGRR